VTWLQNSAGHEFWYARADANDHGCDRSFFGTTAGRVEAISNVQAAQCATVKSAIMG
jgi:hypothetical protein